MKGDAIDCEWLNLEQYLDDWLSYFIISKLNCKIVLIVLNFELDVRIQTNQHHSAEHMDAIETKPEIYQFNSI